MTRGALEARTSAVLRAGTYVGIGVMVIGLLLSAAGGGDLLLEAGIAVLVATPMAGVLVSAACLAVERDMRWLAVALCLVLTIAIGLLASWCL